MPSMTESIANPPAGLYRQRWFGIALTVALMLLGSALFAVGLPTSSVAVHYDAVCFIMTGPFSLPLGQILALHSPGWLIVITISVCMFPLHALRPTAGTLCATLLGGFLWWFIGVLSLGAGC